MAARGKDEMSAYSRAYYQANKEAVKEKTKIRRKKDRLLWIEYKTTLSCRICGQNHPATLDFHHVIIHPDNQTINDLTRSGAYNRVVEELKKCEVLCANCHRIHHHEERMGVTLMKAAKITPTKVLAKRKK